MNGRLVHIANGAVLESFANDSKISLGQTSSYLHAAEGAIKSYVDSTFDKTRPIASLASFITGGLLWSLKSKKLAILYMVAGALGFDWKAFWDALGKSIVAVVQEIHGGKPTTDEDATNKVNQVVESSFPQHFTGKVDMSKVLDLAKRVFAEDLDNALKIKKYSSNRELIKNAGIASKLISFFTSAISWAVKAALVAAGLWVGGKAVKKMIDGKPAPEEGAETQEVPASKLKLSPNASPDLFTPHRNDLSSVWIEHGDIDEIEDTIIDWVINAYPQLARYEDSIKTSSEFQAMVSAFKQRNRLASGLGLVSIPRPYQRKIDIVFRIVNSLSIGPMYPQSGTKYL